MTEEEFLVSEGKTDAAILGNDANWTTIAHVTDNQDAIVDQELENAAPEAQVYRLKVNMGYGDTPWGRHPLPGAGALCRQQCCERL